jgi:cytidylate kinase
MRRLNPQDVNRVLATLRSAEYPHPGDVLGTTPPQRAPAPFVTVSRQAGAGGRSLAVQLAQRLNEIDPGPLPWTVWDNELVERVAADYHLPKVRVAALEDERPSWLEETLANLAIGSTTGHPDELAVYHRVGATIRALAELGRVIIVGRGGAYVTRDMPQGLHVRLVAPLEFRVAATAELLGVSKEKAADWVRETDASREAFYRRHWPNRPVVPENFSMILNSAMLSIPQQVGAILAALPEGPGAAAAATAGAARQAGA